ncbi:MAG: NPCBM/NEW2 domain-containing protein [Planctomycetota bacterium]
MAIFSSGAARSEEVASSPSWHVKDAAVRFRVEKDYAKSLIPHVSLLDIQPDKKSESVQKWIEKNRWTDKRRINGRLCLNFLPSFGSKPIIYNLHKDFTHFVARAGIIDGADPNTSVIFEVYADKRLIFRSDPLTKRRQLEEINTAIPARSKQLKLVVEASDSKYFRWARWVDPGFMLRGRFPEVSSVRIYAPGYNLEDFTPEVFITSSGARVNSRILSAGRGEPMDILFESTKGYPSYLIYLVPKAKQSESSTSWEPRAGLVLETRWTNRGLRSSDKLPQFQEAFDKTAQPVGRSLVDDIQHSFPIHRKPAYSTSEPPARGGFGLYHYKGFFEVPKAGQYTFATISRWDSYLSIDGELVAGWPGQHDIQGGLRGEKKGNISLKPGIHKLEYYHYAQWEKMFAVAAWKKPGEELRVMTRTDFIPFGHYEAVSADFEEPNKPYAAFEWWPVDDFRLEQTGTAFVAMRFKAIRPDALRRYSYRWTFDDGTVAAGETVDHVFLRPALRKVELEVSLDGKSLAQASHDVYVHCAWDKCLMDTDNADFFDEVVKKRDLAKSPPDDLINLSVMAEQADRPDWKTRATAALSEGVVRLVQESGDTDFLFDFGQYLCSAELKKYDKALELFSRLATKNGVDKSVQRRAAVYQAEILIKFFGRNDEALKMLDPLAIDAASPDDLARRAITAKAQAMLGLGQAKEAIDLVQRLSDSSKPADKTKQHIKHAGLLRHARMLAEYKGDAAQLNFAAANIETIIAEDPVKLFAPGENIVKLDIHLAAEEFQAAFYLAERLKNLQLNDYDIAEVLARQVFALCGMKDIEKAKSVYAQLTRDYPRSPATETAKQAIIQALGQ